MMPFNDVVLYIASIFMAGMFGSLFVDIIDHKTTPKPIRLTR